jgi:hypothetical protein
MPQKKTLLQKLSERDRLLKLVKVEGNPVMPERKHRPHAEQEPTPAHDYPNHLDGHHDPKDWTY